MKRSVVLYGILLIMFAFLVIVVFTFPQPMLDDYEWLFLLVVVPIMGVLWIQAYLDGMKGN